jgi:hypothetical protein
MPRPLRSEVFRPQEIAILHCVQRRGIVRYQALVDSGGDGRIWRKENLICLDRFVRRSFDLRKSPSYIVFRDVFAVLTSVAWIPLLERTIPIERNGFDSGSKR